MSYYNCQGWSVRTRLARLLYEVQELVQKLSELNTTYRRDAERVADYLEGIAHLLRREASIGTLSLRLSQCVMVESRKQSAS